MKLSIKEVKELVENQGVDKAIKFLRYNGFKVTSEKLQEALCNYINAQDRLIKAEDSVAQSRYKVEELLGL